MADTSRAKKRQGEASDDGAPAEHFRMAQPGSADAARQIARQIRHAVADGTIKPGEKLPGEHELAASFNVARGTVREAMRTLAATGLVRATRGSTGGTFVTVPEPEWVAEQLSDLLALWFQVGDITLAEVTDARGVLERECVRLAALHRSEDDLAEIRQPVERSRSAELDDAAFLATDLDFHTAVSRAAGNHILELAMTAVHLARPRTNRLLLAQLDRARIADQHWAIYEAIRDQDPDRAVAAFEDHVAHLGELQHAVLPDADPNEIPVARIQE